MDLGLEGRKAIVCASSRGLGKGCATALAEAGVSLVLNGRASCGFVARDPESRTRSHRASPEPGTLRYL